MRTPEAPSDELLVKLTRYLDYFQSLTNLAKDLTAQLNPDDVLQVLTRCISQLLRPLDWSLLLVDESGRQLHFAIAVGDAASRARDSGLEVGQGIAGWVARHRQAVVVPRVTGDPRFRGGTERTYTDRASVLCAPLISRSRLLGVIELVREETDEAEPFGQEHLQLLRPFSDFAAIAIDNARSFARIQELTLVDEWTSLYNARYLVNCMRDEVSRAQPCCARSARWSSETSAKPTAPRAMAAMSSSW
jgi:GAF domain-containing protein